ncbi:MAG: hypothetical protein ABIP94_24940 [Planctomycetota bacterium]
MRVEAVSADANAALILFVSQLDEKLRRLYAGLEALRIGRRGDQRIADLLGLHPQTVAKVGTNFWRAKSMQNAFGAQVEGARPWEKNA